MRYSRFRLTIRYNHLGRVKAILKQYEIFIERFYLEMKR